MKENQAGDQVKNSGSIPFGGMPEDLDAALNAPSQLQVSQFVKGLNADEPNLVWRSELNQKLLAAQRKVTWWKRIRIISPALGIPAAGALALVLVFHVHSSRPANVSTATASVTIEDSILSVHSEVTADREVTGDSLDAHQTTRDATGDLSFENEPSDL